MKNGITGRRLISERLKAGDIDGPLGIQTSSLRTVVVDIQQNPSMQLTLDVHIPHLHITQTVVRIDGEIISDQARGDSRKPVSQSQRIGDAADIGRSKSKRRLER